MQGTILISRRPADATQQAELRKLFASSGYLILKEMVAARCSEAQVHAMTALLYPENDVAVADQKTNKDLAIQLNAFLDMLDDFEKKDQDWFTVKVEVSR